MHANNKTIQINNNTLSAFCQCRKLLSIEQSRAQTSSRRIKLSSISHTSDQPVRQACNFFFWLIYELMKVEFIVQKHITETELFVLYYYCIIVFYIVSFIFTSNFHQNLRSQWRNIWLLTNICWSKKTQKHRIGVST